MPIIVQPGPTFPLRGYTAYLDDLTTIAAALGDTPPTFHYWTDAVGRGGQTQSTDRLTRKDVAGFTVSGPNGALTIHRRRTLMGQARTATIETRSNDATLSAVLDALTARRASILPWRAYAFKFVPRTRRQHINRSWAIAGLIVAAIVAPIVSALLGAF